MKMTKMTALLLAAAMALTACGSTAAASSTAASEAASVETTAAPEATAAPEEPAAETAVTYPLTVTDQLGREVTIEEEPKTLASGYYISTSLLIALGVQNELVGVEAKADKRNIYSLSAPEIQSLPSIGTAKEFDLEGCAALAPDLVIVPAKLKDSIPQMEEMGLTVLAVKPENQAGLFGAIELLAQATNTTARGEELEMAIDSNLAALAEAVAGTDAPSVYLAGNSSVLETAGPAMYQNTMIENANGTNAAASVEDTYWAEASYEQILDWNPDYIILASDAEYDVDKAEQDYLTLSGGERQLCILARTFVEDAPLLLLDEPDSALDLANRSHMAALLAEFVHASGKTALICLHDPMLMLDWCDTLIVLQNGQVGAMLYPRTDPVEALQSVLAAVYGPLELVPVTDRTGRVRLALLPL